MRLEAGIKFVRGGLSRVDRSLLRTPSRAGLRPLVLRSPAQRDVRYGPVLKLGLAAQPNFQQSDAVSPGDTGDLAGAVDNGFPRGAVSVSDRQLAEPHVRLACPGNEFPPEGLPQRTEHGQQFIQYGAPDEEVRTTWVVDCCLKQHSV